MLSKFLDNEINMLTYGDGLSNVNLKDGNYKTIAIFSKRARGLMTRYIVDNNINSIEGIKGFNSDGYLFTESISSNNELVFSR